MLSQRFARARSTTPACRQHQRLLVCNGGSHPVHGTSTPGGREAQRQLHPSEDLSTDALAVRLRDNLGISFRKYQTYIQPRIIEYAEDSGPADVAPVLDMLLALGGPDRVHSLILTHPELLTVEELPAWLEFFTQYGVRRDAFFSLLSTHTRLFTRPSSLYYAGLAIMYLVKLGLTHRDLSRSVIPKCAVLLGADPQQQLQPVVDFIVDELGFTEPARSRKLIAKCPQLLTRCVETQLRPRLAYMESLGYSRQEVRLLTEDVTSLLLQDPRPQLGAALTFLTCTCSIPQDQALNVLLACPSIITLSTPHLKRKWDFLVDEMQGGAAELAAWPQYLACSLLNETGPRFFFAKERRATGFFSAPLPASMSAAMASSTTSSGSSALGAAATASRPIVSLQALLGCELSDYLTLVGAPEEEFEEFRRLWQVSEGRRWSGMVSIVRWDGSGSW